MKRIDDKPLVFPVGDKEYTVPPVGWDCGLELMKYLGMGSDKLAGVKLKSDALMKLAVSPDVWEQMRGDGVAAHIMFRAGLSALAHFKSLADGSTAEDALKVAEAVWESGIDPEALAAKMAANLPDGSTTSPGTGKAASSTKRPASTSPTTSPRRKASTSRKPSPKKS